MGHQLAMAKFFFLEGNKSKIKANFGIKWYKKQIKLTYHFQKAFMENMIQETIRW